MKGVLFCDGYGMRMRTAEDDVVQKPLQMVGPRPLLWHVMRCYAHYGHKEFILCRGYGADKIKDFFLSYCGTESNDFVIRAGQIELLDSEICSSFRTAPRPETTSGLVALEPDRAISND